MATGVCNVLFTAFACFWSAMSSTCTLCLLLCRLP
jgi:hypothetical protein